VIVGVLGANRPPGAFVTAPIRAVPTWLIISPAADTDEFAATIAVEARAAMDKSFSMETPLDWGATSLPGDARETAAWLCRQPQSDGSLDPAFPGSGGMRNAPESASSRAHRENDPHRHKACRDVVFDLQPERFASLSRRYAHAVDHLRIEHGAFEVRTASVAPREACLPAEGMHAAGRPGTHAGLEKFVETDIARWGNIAGAACLAGI
jgi:hypothetical protein